MVYQDPGSGSPSGGGSTTDVAKEQAGRVGQKATEAGGQVAQTTKEQAQQVVGEAKQQARDLVGEARTQVRDQAGTQRDRAVQGLRTLSDELDQMSQGGQSGLATEVARQLSGRTRELAGHLERHEPSDLLEQVRAYARRRPVVFLAGAALAGVVAGRLTKSLAAGAPDSGARALGADYGNGYRPGEPLAVGAAPYASPDYPGAGYQPGTGYQPDYQAAGDYPAPGTDAGYSTAPGAGTGAAYGSEPAEGYGSGGFRDPDAGYATGTGAGTAYGAGDTAPGTGTGAAYGAGSDAAPGDYGSAPAEGYGSGGFRDPDAGPVEGDYPADPGLPPASGGPGYPSPTVAPYDPDQPARGWNP